MRGSRNDVCFFEELEAVTGPGYDYLSENVWSVIYSYFKWNNFKGMKIKERAFEFAMDVHSLFCSPINNPPRPEGHLPASCHYRTLSEILGAKDRLALTGQARLDLERRRHVFDALRDAEFIQLHPHWPLELKDHPQAPYRPIVCYWWNR